MTGSTAPPTAKDDLSLRPCIGIWGEDHLMYGDPPIQRIEGAILVPFKSEGAWGLYDRDRKPVIEAVDRRGADRVPHHPVEWDIADPISQDESGETYFYCGRLNPHFGHFLINTLPKFWPFYSARTRPTERLLSAESATGLQGFARDILDRLGVQTKEIVSFDRPTQVSAVIVPSPGILEQYWAYTIFKDLCEQIGSTWWSGIDTIETPAYLSKARLTSGVGRFFGESIVEEVMRKAGVDIFHPEEMTIAEQVRLFSERRLCIGPTGSAFHAAVFAPKRRRIICFNPADRLNSNYALLDKLGEHKATYLYQPGMTYESGRNGFLTTVMLADPERLAQDLLAIVEAQVGRSYPLDGQESATAASKHPENDDD